MAKNKEKKQWHLEEDYWKQIDYLKNCKPGTEECKTQAEIAEVLDRMRCRHSEKKQQHPVLNAVVAGTASIAGAVLAEVVKVKFVTKFLIK